MGAQKYRFEVILAHLPTGISERFGKFDVGNQVIDSNGINSPRSFAPGAKPKIMQSLLRK